MWNDTEEPFFVSTLEEEEPPYELDESSYSIFFSTYNPSSPVYSQNNTNLGVTIGMLKFCIEGVAITTLGILGVIGNLLSICVLSSPRMKNSSSCFLMGLAMCDIMVLLGSTLLIGIPSLLTYHPEENGDTHEGEGSLFVFNENIVKYANIMPSAALFSISVTALSGSNFFIMALTLERYLAVCRPFHARHLCTWSRACVMSVIIIIAALAYNATRWLEFTYVEETTINNLTMYRPVPTPFRANPAYDTYYIYLSYAVFQFFLPICFLIVFNILIYREIKQANKLRQNMSPTQKNDNSITRVLFGVVAVFLLCNLTPAIHSMYRYATRDLEYVPELEFVWCFLIILNSSVNFLIYCASGGKFREIFCQMFCCWRSSARRIRQFAASTRTTFRSLSTSTTSRSRTYSVYSTRRSSSNHHNINFTNNNAIFPDGKFSFPPLPPASKISDAVAKSFHGQQNNSIEHSPTPPESADVSFIV